ncbi:MAG: leucine-rich repeat domain-containing protein [Clostridia bacterium]|nr:leucine-rich repeat domain-containing protein [Clostridia bacterium]
MKKRISFLLETLALLALLFSLCGISASASEVSPSVSVSSENTSEVKATASTTYSGTCGTNLTWSLDTTTGVLKIRGSGKMYNYEPSSVLWDPYSLSIKSVEIENGVTSIDSDAFYKCSNLASIEIPYSVTSIGECAFSYHRSLKSIVVDENNPKYKSIDGNLYSKDGKILIQYAIGESNTSFTIPEGVTSIGKDAFSSCDSLTSITIPDSVTSIGSGAFSDCGSLESVYISDIASWCGIEFGNDSANPLYYAENLYLNNTLITDLVIPDGVTRISDFAFCDCDSLTSMEIPDSVTSIGASAFLWCDSLTRVTFGENSQLTSIGEMAFSQCGSLTSVTIPNSVTSIGDSAFNSSGDIQENHKKTENSLQMIV